MCGTGIPQPRLHKCEICKQSFVCDLCTDAMYESMECENSDQSNGRLYADQHDPIVNRKTEQLWVCNEHQHRA